MRGERGDASVVVIHKRKPITSPMKFRSGSFLKKGHQGTKALPKEVSLGKLIGDEPLLTSYFS